MRCIYKDFIKPGRTFYDFRYREYRNTDRQAHTEKEKNRDWK